MPWGASKTTENDAQFDIKSEAKKAAEDIKEGFSRASEDTSNAYDKAKEEAQERVTSINDYLTRNNSHIGSTYNVGPRMSRHEQQRSASAAARSSARTHSDGILASIRTNLNYAGRKLDQVWPHALSPRCLGAHPGHVHSPKYALALQLGAEPHRTDVVRADVEGRVSRAVSLGATVAVNASNQQVVHKAVKANVHLLSLLNSKAACSVLDVYVGGRLCQPDQGSHVLCSAAAVTPHIGVRYVPHANAGVFFEYDACKLVGGLIFRG